MVADPEAKHVNEAYKRANKLDKNLHACNYSYDSMVNKVVSMDSV